MGSFLERRRMMIAVSLILGWCGVGALGQSITEANVPKQDIKAYAGEPLEISCESFGNPVKICIWERFNADKSKPSTLTSYTQGSSNTTTLPGYMHYGDLEGGVCGLRAENITRHDMAKWQCTLFGESSVYRGALSISVIHKPDAPKFSPEDLGSLVDGDSFGVSGAALSCYAANGLPPPSFKWYIGDEPYKGELFPLDTKEDDKGNTYTFQQLKNQKFTWRDNGKKIRCVIVHDLIGDDEVKEASLPIVVKYKPRAEQNSVTAYVPEVGQPVTNLDFSFFGNPKPRIFWEVDGVRISAGFSSPDRRTDAVPLEQIGNATWKARLRVRDITSTDLRRKYILKTENDVGKQDFEICISQNAARAGTTCGSQALFFNLKPQQAPPPQLGTSADENEGDNDNEEDNDDDNRADEAPEPSEHVIVRLQQVREAMETLREEEVNLMSQLPRRRIPKESGESGVGLGSTSVVADTIATTGSVGTGVVLTLPVTNTRERAARQQRPITSRRTLPRPETETRDGSEVSEVKVESGGIYIRRKLITA